MPWTSHVTEALKNWLPPPNGLKHKILARTSPDTLISAMQASIEGMIAGGTAGFADFREGGAEGVTLLRRASEGKRCQPVILGASGW